MFFLLEMKWWDQRTMRHLILGGVLEQNPGIHFVFTESGAAWIPRELKVMDSFYDATRRGEGHDEVIYNGSQPLDGLSMKPSEYWRRQCYAGASFMHPAETRIRHSVGVGNMMWGSDYPHVEASFPYSKEAIRFCFAGTPETEVDQMLAGNAAKVYGFSLASLRPLAEQSGPGRAEVTAGVDPAFLPANAAKCPAFAGAMPGSATTQMGDNRATREQA
jgi:predicted TIM-barrel fold metal-dependent hydrolase